MNTPKVEVVITLSEKKGCMPITIPKHEPIKKVYVELVRQIVESEAKNDEGLVIIWQCPIVWKLWRTRMKRICGFLSRFAWLHY